ncbi:hypothetical protein MJM59_31575, partial [Salmonella enterica subsp. enterica serovar Montevideo]|nr:hypothetical protein [Salmonella enterica subsp. enterica serovar Montevideo]
MDEPTSSLTEKEVNHLFTIIRKLKERGCGIVYISHKMEEIFHTPLQQAFKDRKNNYHTPEGRAYTAVRVPQFDANPSLSRKIKS